jgi:hypothetical protein
MTEEKKHIEYATAFGTWLNRTTATLFFVLLTMKILGVETATPVSWVLVFTPMFVRWGVLILCIIVAGTAACVDALDKKKR